MAMYQMIGRKIVLDENFMSERSKTQRAALPYVPANVGRCSTLRFRLFRAAFGGVVVSEYLYGLYAVT